MLLSFSAFEALLFLFPSSWTEVVHSWVEMRLFIKTSPLAVWGPQCDVGVGLWSRSTISRGSEENGTKKHAVTHCLCVLWREGSWWATAPAPAPFRAPFRRTGRRCGTQTDSVTLVRSASRRPSCPPDPRSASRSDSYCCGPPRLCRDCSAGEASRRARGTARGPAGSCSPVQPR